MAIKDDEQECKTCDGTGSLCDGCGNAEGDCECDIPEGSALAACPDCDGAGVSTTRSEQ